MTATDPRSKVLTGWGRTSPTRARVERPETVEDACRLLRQPRRQIVARGLGRSYGDAAQCAGGTVAETAGLASIGPIDARSGAIEVGGGACLSDVLRRTLLAGWFVRAVPGTSQVTIGGAIAADVHGKNHRGDGAFCSHVSTMALATPTGSRAVGPGEDPELFWATAGGMGLTGIVTTATLELLRVETPWMLVDTERFGGLDDLMEAMAGSDEKYRYSVAWLDWAGRVAVVQDAFANPQTVIVFGGTSDIAAAILDQLVADRCRRLILAGRDPAALNAQAARLQPAPSSMGSAATSRSSGCPPSSGRS